MCNFAIENMRRMSPVDNTPLQKNAMNHHGVEEVLFCTFSSKNATYRNYRHDYTQSISKNLSRFSFTGKERDEETGYGYFGARYMDHELMTMWLSVDPMADKYPSISPYNYCMWNPVKLIDPDGCDTLVFNKYGNYSHSIKSDGEHVGRYEQPSGNPYTFTFADPINDPIAIEEGKITKLQIVKEDDIKKMLRDAGVFCDDNRKRKYGYAKEEGVGLGKLDFSKKAEKGMASLYKINTYKSMYLIDGVAHNPENFGNFLFGAAGNALGIPLTILKLGAHWNSIVNSKKNGYKSQLDSKDDQFSIKCGFNHAQRHNYNAIKK